MGAVTVGEIRVNARFNTASFVSDASKLNATAKQTSADIKNSFDRVDFAESNEGARLLNELLQTHLPRGLTRLISQLPGLGAAFSSALPVIAVAVFAQKIVELVEHISNASEAAKKAAGEYGEFAQATERNAQSIALENLKLEDQLRVLQGKPSKNGPAIAMEEARLKAEELTSQIQKAIDKEKELLKKQSVGFWASVLGDTKTSDIVDFVTEGKAAIAELERQKGVALQAHDDKLVASLQKEISAKNQAMQDEITRRTTAEDDARNDKLAKDLAAARTAASNAKPILAFGQTQSPQEQVAASMSLRQEIAKHEAAINEPVDARIKLYSIALEQLKAESAEERDQTKNSQLHLAIDQERDKLRNVFTNTNKSTLSTGSSHDANGKFLDAEETKRRADEKASLEAAAALNKAHQFDVGVQAKIDDELDKQRIKWDEISALTAKDALLTQEHIIKMQEASGLITKRQADAKIAALYAQGELNDTIKRNAELAKQLALVAHLNALTKGGTAGSDADKAAYAKAMADYQKFLLDKEKAKAASDAKIYKAEEDAAAKTFAIQKKAIDV